jgi:2-polyprenyl-3-methyl-5-hydroxy-6-metoxy-1,4-benzoquinol methylase
VIGERHRYDWIVASHVIDVPNLVAFLIDCEALLKPGASLVLAVPDKRCLLRHSASRLHGVPSPAGACRRQEETVFSSPPRSD